MNQQIIDRLLAAEGSILVACHRTPDGDTLGAGLAVFLWLKGLGKNARGSTAPTLCRAYTAFFRAAADVTAEMGEPPDVFVAVDCASADRIGDGRRGTPFKGCTLRSTSTIILQIRVTAR